MQFIKDNIIYSARDVRVALKNISLPAVLVAEHVAPYGYTEYTPPIQEPSPSEIKGRYISAVQTHLDQAATAKGYDNIISACSYGAAPNVFQPEGLAFITWRGEVWEYCFQVLADVESETRPMPTVTALLLELPLVPPIILP